jgi:hypothetical protein
MPSAHRGRLALHLPQGRQARPGTGETRLATSCAARRSAPGSAPTPEHRTPRRRGGVGRLGPGLLLAHPALRSTLMTTGMTGTPSSARPGSERRACMTPGTPRPPLAGAGHRHPRCPADPRALTAQPDPALCARQPGAHPARRRPDGESAMGLRPGLPRSRNGNRNKNCNWKGSRYSR